MMQLSRLCLLQWHLLARADLDLWGNSAILGQNRSGKSTLIDLIQAVMAGGSARYYRFNRSAGEAGGRSERTLRGYCLGQLNEHESLRPNGAITHIGLVFADPDGARPPVSIGLCVEATAQDEVQIVGRYVAPGIQLDSALWIETRADGELASAPWSVVRPRLEAACKAEDAELLLHDNARSYIRDYMRLLFTGRRAIDPERFVRAFVLALSFEDMRSVEHFVHNYLLERNDIDIGELRDSIQRYREIQRDIHELEQRLEALRNMQRLIGEFEEQLQREETARGVARLASLIEAGGALFANLADLRDKTEALDQTNAEIERHEGEIRTLKRELESLDAQLKATDQASQRQQLAVEIEMADKERNGVLVHLLARYTKAAWAATLLDQKEQLAPLKLGLLMQALETVKAQSAGLTPPDWPSDPAAMEKALAEVGQIAVTQLPKVIARRDEAIRYRQEIEETIRGLDSQREQARAGRIVLDDRTRRLIERLKEEGMRPRAVCEVTDVIDDSWRHAAEALLGRNREAILVDPEHASRAVSILRSHRDEFRGCRVANTRRLVDLARQAEPGTLASVLSSDDPLAMAFIVFRAGSVRLAETQDMLLGSGRAIMRDGAYNDGIVVDVLRAQDLKIGRAAAPLMLAELERGIQEQRALLGHHKEAEKLHDDVRRRLEAMSEPVAEGLQLERLLLEIDRIDAQREDLQARSARVAATIDPALREAVETTKRQLDEIQEDKVKLIEQRGGLNTGLKQIGDLLGKGEGLLGSRLCFAARLRQFRQTVRNREQLRPLRAKYESLRPQSPSRMVPLMAKEEEKAREERLDHESRIREALGRYRVAFGGTGPSGAQQRILGEVKPWVDENASALEDNELIRYRRQADDAADQIGRLFRSAFVHELNSRFSGLRTELDNLTRALRTRPLHNEIYTLHARVKPEFEALYRLAQESENDETALNALFGRGVARDDRHAQALAEVERLLSDEQLDFSIYQDYRTYFTFDLQMRDVTSGRSTSFDRRRGVASGAERQVPYYVIIGAALSSIYHGTRRQQSDDELGIGLAVFDEAFSKMDGPNQRTLLDFYREIGLQVLIAAPSEKRSVVLENLECIVDVFRSGDEAVAESARIKDHARDQMRASNPHHLSDDEVAAMLEAGR